MSAPTTDRSAALDDLEVLQRPDAAGPQARKVRRALLPRLLVALLVLGGIAALYGAFLDPLLFPPREVRLAPVREMSGGSAPSRTAVAPAAGWLEAEPFPVTVRPLVPGVVERLEVVEGQAVKRDETVIAVLRNVDLENALRTAEAEVAAKTAQAVLAEARSTRAKALLEQKIDVRAAALLAELESRRAAEAVREAQAEVARSEGALEKAAAEVDAQRALRGTGGTPSIALRIAEAEQKTAQAEREVRLVALGRARAEADVRVREHALAQEALADPRALAGEAAVAAQEAAAARSEERLATVRAEVARGQVARLTVKAPVDGVVQRLLASVGAPTGPDAPTAREMSTVGPGSTGALDIVMGGLALLYDPAHLQARVEVPVADLASIDLGSEVALEVDTARGRTFRGQVLRLVGEANIQNNKLWVKVRLLETDPLLRPEMLVRAKFLAKPVPEGEAASGRPRLSVPSTALQGGAVFVFDPTRGGRARRVPVETRGESGGFTEVEGALGLSNEVILEPHGLEDGMKVRPLR